MQYNIYFPLLQKKHKIPEITYKQYLDLYKVYNVDKEDFVLELGKLCNIYNIDIYSLFLLILFWRKTCICDDSLKFEKTEHNPHDLYDNICKNLDNFMLSIINDEKYIYKHLIPQFHTINNIFTNKYSYTFREIDSDLLQNLQANVLFPLQQILKSKYPEYDNKLYCMELIKDKYVLTTNKSDIVSWYSSLFFPYEMDYLQSLIIRLAKETNLGGNYLENKSIIELHNILNKINNTEQEDNPNE